MTALTKPSNYPGRAQGDGMPLGSDDTPDIPEVPETEPVVSLEDYYDQAPTLKLPDRPVLKPLPTLPDLDGMSAEQRVAARAKYHAVVSSVRDENAKVERAWRKDCKEAEAEHRVRLGEHNRYLATKKVLQERQDRAVRNCNRREERKAILALKRLDRKRELEIQKAETAERAQRRAVLVRQAAIDGAVAAAGVMEAAARKKEEERRERLEKKVERLASALDPFGDPFAGLTDEQRKARMLGACYHSGAFFVQRVDGTWMQLDRTRMEEMLEAHAGLSTTADRDIGGMSPAKRARLRIETTREVDGVGHYTWVPPGFLPEHVAGFGNRVLNLSTTRLPPRAPARDGAWGEGFPIIALALQNAMGARMDPHGRHQLDTLLAVMSRSVKGIAAGRPRIVPGTLFVGDPNTGKGWTSNLIRLIFGGVSADPWQYFLSGCAAWNDDLAKAGVWLTKDPIPVTERERLRVTSALKQALSDAAFRVQTRWKTAGEVARYQWWVCTLNKDAKSRSCIPSKDISDKLLIFAFWKALPDALFQRTMDNPEELTAEIPHLLSWLLQYTPPESVVGGPRYGVKAWCHPLFRETTGYGAACADVGDLLQELAAALKATIKEWKGSAQALLNECLAAGMNVRNWDNMKLGRGLTTIHENNPEAIPSKKDWSGTMRYTVNLEFYRREPEGLENKQQGGNAA